MSDNENTPAHVAIGARTPIRQQKQHLGRGKGKTLCGRPSGFSMGPATPESKRDLGDALCRSCLTISDRMTATTTRTLQENP